MWVVYVIEKLQMHKKSIRHMWNVHRNVSMHRKNSAQLLKTYIIITYKTGVCLVQFLTDQNPATATKSYRFFLKMHFIFYVVI